MAGRDVPHSIDAEMALLGAVLLRQTIMIDLVGVLDATDFYDPVHQAAFAAMTSLWEDGRSIDQITLHTAAPSVPVARMAEWLAVTPSVSGFGSYASVVIDASRRRRLIAHLGLLTDRAYAGDDIDSVLGDDPASADKLIGPRSAEIRDLHDIGEFMLNASRHEMDLRPWLIPHIIKPLWRAIVVAPEGWGKAVLLRFLAIHAAAGRDPWQPHYRIPQRRVLYIDVENAESSIHHQFAIANTMDGVDIVGEATGWLSLWHREGGIDIRQRRTRAELEAVLQKTRPEIVCAGPLYKLYRRGKGEDLEQAALEFVEVLDDLRTRFGFALLLEHHAPKGSGGARELNPFGSSVFMRWPEFGLTLEPVGDVLPTDDQYILKLGRFRRDRETADWPTDIERKPGRRTPWSPVWERGRGTAVGMSRHPEHGEWVPRGSF